MYVTDLRAGGVHRLRPDGGVDVLVPTRTGAGGTCLHADGGIVVSGPDISHLRRGHARVLLSLDDVEVRSGARAAGFNDICADDAGRILAGVLRVDDGGRPVPGELLLVTGMHRSAVVYDDCHPNGLAFSPDGSRLYHSDTWRQRLLVFDTGIGMDVPVPIGSISTAKVPGLPDGLAADEQGYIWAAFYRGWCVARFTPSGAVDTVIGLPAHKPLSVCFGGTDRASLYVVTGRSDEQPDYTGSIYRLPVRVKGAAVAVARI